MIGGRGQGAWFTCGTITTTDSPRFEGNPGLVTRYPERRVVGHGEGRVSAETVTGRLVGAGRSADTYPAGDGRVLRRYRDARAPAWVAREAEVMAHPRAHAVPVPEVFDVTGRCCTGTLPPGRARLERLPGAQPAAGAGLR